MRLLIIKRSDENNFSSREFKDCGDNLELDFLSLSGEEQKNLKSSLADVSFSHYDRVIFKLKFHYIKNQSEFFLLIKNLTIVEYDSCGNFMLNPRFLEFEYFYHKIPHAQFILTGLYPSIKFQMQGLNAVFVPKAYDEYRLQYYKPIEERSVKFGFIGNTKGYLYSGRRKILKGLRDQIDLIVSTTNTFEEYNERLNEIKFFISADIGFREYMAKNFEAMACGCVLVAYRVGGEEVLGFRDMDNVILYSSAAEALCKINHVISNDGMLKLISDNGRELVSKRYTFARRNNAVFDAICSAKNIPYYHDNRSFIRRVICNTLHAPLVRKLLRLVRKSV